MTEGRLAYAEELTRMSRQIVGVMLVSWQRILRVGLFSAIVTLLASEIVACVLTASFPPPPMAHLIAGALAFAAGYNVAITALFAMLLRGGVRFVRHLEGDVSVGASVATVFARREVGDLGAGARRLFSGHNQRQQAPRPALSARGRPDRPAIQPRPAVSAQAAVAAVGLDVARVAMPRSLPPDVRRDPDDAIIRTPAPALQSLPVLASRLPRIGWTYDEYQPAFQPLPTPVPSATPASPASPAPAPTPVADTMADDTENPTPAANATPQPASSIASEEPLTAREEPTTVVATVGTPDAPGLIPRGWRRTDTTTRPLPAVTRPLPAPGAARSGGLWDRVSQALVGQATTDTATEASEDTTPTQPQVAADVAPEDAWLNG